MQAFYGAVQQDPSFFTRRQALDPEMKIVRRYGRSGVVLELIWDSDFSPTWSELAVHGRLSQLAAERGDHQGIVAVVLHGYMGGHFALEERIWPIRTLFEGGMDVILTVRPPRPAHACRQAPAAAPVSGGRPV